MGSAACKRHEDVLYQWLEPLEDQELPDHVNHNPFVHPGRPATRRSSNRTSRRSRVRRVPSSTKILQREYITPCTLIIRPPINAHGTWQQLASRVYFYIHTYSSQHSTYYGHAHNQPIDAQKNLDEPICPCASHACRSPGTAFNQRARNAR